MCVCVCLDVYVCASVCALMCVCVCSQTEVTRGGDARPRGMSARQDSNIDELTTVGDELKGETAVPCVSQRLFLTLASVMLGASAKRVVPSMPSARELEGADLAGTVLVSPHVCVHLHTLCTL